MRIKGMIENHVVLAGQGGFEIIGKLHPFNDEHYFVEKVVLGIPLLSLCLFVHTQFW